MPAKKKIKARTARPSGKKGIAKKAVSRAASKGTAAKRTRKAPVTKSVRRAISAAVPQTAEPLVGAAELEAKQAVRKPIKKAVAARPARPPASLPIPQSTFFF
jgi:hypothetical protein